MRGGNAAVRRERWQPMITEAGVDYILQTFAENITSVQWLAGGEWQTGSHVVSADAANNRLTATVTIDGTVKPGVTVEAVRALNAGGEELMRKDVSMEREAGEDMIYRMALNLTYS